MRSDLDLDQLALLEEQRDDLLASLDRLDRELRRGDIDEVDHSQLHDDLTRRAADVIRALEAHEMIRPTRIAAPKARRLWVVLGLVVIATAMGVAVASSSGLRLPGQTGSGEIDRSSRDLLLQAELLFAQGDLQEASSFVDDVLTRLPADEDALILRARIAERSGEILDAIKTLDAILLEEPDSIEALTLKGWILVRIDDEEELWTEGIRLLDRAIDLEPRVFDPFLFRAIAAERLEANPTSAIAYYRQALDRNPPAAMVPQLERFIAALEP